MGLFPLYLSNLFSCDTRQAAPSHAGDQVRGELLDALKPTPDMVGKIQQNPHLIAGEDVI